MKKAIYVGKRYASICHPFINILLHILYICIQRTPEKACLNDVTEVGTWRRTALVVTIFLVALILLPLWDELAEELGIGLVTSF